jgi:subtilisin family serine protease
MNKRLLRTLCVVLCLVVCGAMMILQQTKKNTADTPVVIGIIDTGISTRAIPVEHILEGSNYLDSSLSTEDTYGHGTAVASVILKNYPRPQLVPLVSNAYDNGKIRQVDNDVFAQMIRDAVDIYHCHIINLSVGLILDKPSIREAVAYAEENGVLVVASVGNDYAADGDFMYYPAGYDTVLAVGSVNRDHTAISDFSQRGKWVDVYAVGEDVTITTLSGNTRQSEGTSYSAARVTAHAACLLEQNPTFSPAQLREKLLNEANSLPDGTKYIP